MDYSFLLTKLKPKTKEEILARLAELIHRHSRRYLRKNSRPCPFNCEFAIETRSGVVGCDKCGSKNIEVCNNEEDFTPYYTKEELYQQFQEDIHDPEILVRNYRDVATLMWALGVDNDDI